jgi:hypothetical protein
MGGWWRYFFTPPKALVIGKVQKLSLQKCKVPIHPHAPVPFVQSGFVGACYHLTLALRHRAQGMALALWDDTAPS